MTPPALDHAVKACWNHDPNEHRLQTASDLMRELKWIAEYADLHGIQMAPHGTGDGVIGLAALVQVCATMPGNYIAFEYPTGKPDWWYDIIEGLPPRDQIVKDSYVDVWDTPGLGIKFNVEAATKYLREEDAGFFDD